MATGDDKLQRGANGTREESPREFSSSPCYLHEFEATCDDDTGPNSPARPDAEEWWREMRCGTPAASHVGAGWRRLQPFV